MTRSKYQKWGLIKNSNINYTVFLWQNKNAIRKCYWPFAHRTIKNSSRTRDIFVCLFKFCGAISLPQIKVEINKNYYFCCCCCCCKIHACEKSNSISTLTTFLTKTNFSTNAIEKSVFFSNFDNCANTNK